VRFDTGGSLLGDLLSASLLPDLAIAATDSYGVSSGTKTMGTLLDASLLHSLAGDSGVIEGTPGDDTLTGTVVSDRLYGYAGNDTLSGDDGNDLLRGGSGTNTLNGDGGNDILISTGINDTLNGGTGDDFIMISDNLFASIDGGDGFDILQMDGGFTLDSTSVATVSNIELIDMGTGDAGSTLTLTADAVDTLTDADNQLYITGESNDTLNVAGAVDTGAQTTLDSVVFDVYSFGVNQLFVDQDVQVIV
jgi:Ca2+-binding RTX toxin-like protein